MLQALNVLDLLELTGSSVEAAEHLHLSQPTVSRRSRRIASDLGVELRQHSSPHSLRCGDGACLRLLRRAAKRHRLEAGVARIAADGWLAEALEGLEAVLPLPPRFRSIRQWHGLVRSHVVDGALVCGQELRQQIPDLPAAEQAIHGPVAWDGCVLIPLQPLQLSLVRARHQRAYRPGVPRWNGVVLPPLPTCPVIATLVRQQQKRALHLRRGHNTPAIWAQSLAGNPVEALVSPGWRRQLEATGLVLEAVPTAQPLNAEVWLLVHRRDWSKHPELARLARQIRNQLQNGPSPQPPPPHPE
jgi:DNA-binding transcriptional LysR family regulator